MITIAGIKRLLLVVVMLGLCGLLLPTQAFAHASLIEASPAPDSNWDAPPTEVTLTFNERLENQLFYIRVLDSRGESVTSEEAVMSEDQRVLSLTIPELSDDVYTVTYRVISADGHPVGGSYVFTIGEPKVSSPATDNVHLTHQHDHSGSLSIGQVLLYAVRGLYYLSLLSIVGWTFWRIVWRIESEDVKKVQRTWSSLLQRIFILSLLAMIGMQIPDLVESLTLSNFMALLNTSIGISWLASLVLAIVGLYGLNRSKVFDGLWIVLMLAAKSMNGHAMAFEPQIGTVALNAVHLFAASVWAGGLLLALVLWRKEKEYAVQFLPRFSQAAFISIILLTASGIASTMLFLPQLSYVWHTQWGILLLVKTALVLLVIVLGGLLRWQMRKRQGMRSASLLKTDFALMLLIVAIVGVFTYSNPLPTNEPLDWHVMGDTAHMSAKITPNIPGTMNDFNVAVWLPEGQGAPKHVQLRLKFMDDPDMAPIEVPLTAAQMDLPYSFPGFERFDFSGNGPYLAFPGRWEVEVRLMNAEDMEFVYNKEMRIYLTK